MKSLFKIVIIAFFALLACNRDPGFSKTPVISFNSLRFKTNTGGVDTIQLQINYQDEDGDLGLSDSDTLSPYDQQYDTSKVPTNLNYYNIYITFLFKNHDKKYRDCDSTPGCITSDAILRLNNGRFPRLNTGNAKPISGILTYNIQSSQFHIIFKNNVLKFKVKIQDRALHQSNTIETDTLLIK